MVCLGNEQKSIFIFEIAPKYCISASFVDYEGYSISSKGFSPMVVDIVVIWIKFAHSFSHPNLSPCCCLVTQWCLTLCNPRTAAHQASLSITSSLSLLKFTSIESVMPSNHLVLCHPLLLPPSVFPSIRVFSNESVIHIRWPEYWSFSFSISPSNEYSGLISFRMDWLDLLAVQGTLKSLLQHRSSKASILAAMKLKDAYSLEGKLWPT